MADGDAVETAAAEVVGLLSTISIQPALYHPQEMLPMARQVIQALVDGGHYVPATRLWALEHARDLLAERDAAITRAETAEALLQQADGQLGLGIHREPFSEQWKAEASELVSQIRSCLARQAVTREDEQ